jgi:8-oxo-dGTP pyrophosphatase MutT (NUDIX family)
MEPLNQLQAFKEKEGEWLGPIVARVKEIVPLFNYLHYTDHGMPHSEAIILCLDKLLGRHELNRHEKLILVASAYLHDIGMGFRDDGTSIDPERPDFEARRRGHPERSARIVKEKFKDLLESKYIHHVAMVCEMHGGVKGKDFFAKENPNRKWRVGQEDVNILLIAGLFRLADELHIEEGRVNTRITGAHALDNHGQFEVYKNLYVAGVGVESGIIRVTFRFPDAFFEQSHQWVEKFFVDSCLTKIGDELRNVDKQDVLWNNGIALKVGEPELVHGSTHELPASLRLYLTQNFFGNYAGRVQFAGRQVPFYLMGGKYKAGDIDYQWRERDRSLLTKLNPKKYRLPEEFGTKYREIVEAKKKELGAKFYNAINYRLRWCNVNTVFNFSPTERHRLSLEFQLCEYFEFMASNQQLRSGGIPPEAYLTDPCDLEGSKLANPLAVLLSVHLVKENKIMLARRGEGLHEYPGTYHVAVAGSMCHGRPKRGKPDKSDKWDYRLRKRQIIPSPVKAAYREAEEETGLEKTHISGLYFWGLGRDLTNGKPELLGTIETTLTERQILNVAQTRHDIFDTKELVFEEFTPKALCEHLRNPQKWVPGGYVNVLLTLIGTYGTDAVEDAFDALGT